ncbi:uncharacterized protein N7484_007789 [Penicillium longicatenatum]|uniref:uncharacterized protein n=1 Tax=Penicillium longicatenatum TaxID=1561947 RepID=UPI0025494798|nr:uncharacterized protein N7484_007789 [Penicillium longicatenatum]KAJ5639927.1 hypothetical protein N7484_007789 [Penicillium longicatenatum]
MKVFSFLLFLLSQSASALRYDQQLLQWDLDENKTAQNVVDYWSKWPEHTYQPSPSNWRFPFYTIFLDRFVDGEPENNDINDTLDYIQGIGIKGMYIAGTPFANYPWKSDSYSPSDYSLLDRHYGTIQQWRSTIDEIHRRGMYVTADSTYGTMVDLLGFKGFLNSTAPLNPLEYQTVWKGDERYFDFMPGDEYKQECQYPTFYTEEGRPVQNGSDSFFDELKGCYDSEFDLYGAIDSIDLAPDWKKSLAKTGLVQDRLREWVPSVREKIEHFTCMLITSLDIDALRIDKAGQISVDALASSSRAIRESTHTRRFISGRGREPEMRPQNPTQAISLTNSSDDQYFLRESEGHAMDDAVFHYSIYRALTRFLGLDGNYTAPGDTSIDFVDAWNDILVSNDLININTGKFDPRHMMGTANQDTFRWPSIRQGTEKMQLGQFITSLHLPGIPLLLWGEEQNFYLLDSTSSLESALVGCYDNEVGLDHRDPTHPVRNIIKSFYHLRENVPSLKDGFYLESLSRAPTIGNSSVEYDFDCSSPFNGFLAPFSGGVKVRNLLAPYDEIVLQSSQVKLGIHGSTDYNGCLGPSTFQAVDFRAYVPSSRWISPPVVMTEFLLGYDARIESNTNISEGESIDLELRFSEKLDCDCHREYNYSIRNSE